MFSYDDGSESLDACLWKTGKIGSCDGLSAALVDGKVADRGESRDESACLRDWSDVSVLCQNTCHQLRLSFLSRKTRSCLDMVTRFFVGGRVLRGYF